MGQSNMLDVQNNDLSAAILTHFICMDASTFVSPQLHCVWLLNSLLYVES